MIKSILLVLLISGVSLAQQNVVVDYTYDQQADGFTVYWQWQGNTFNKSVIGTDVRSIAIPQEHFIPDAEYVFRMEAFTLKDGPGGPSNEYNYVHDLNCPDPYTPPDDKLGSTYPQECK